ncbi:hypothetical protein Tco_1071237 [Tanacetum coccineum]
MDGDGIAIFYDGVRMLTRRRQGFGDGVRSSRLKRDPKKICRLKASQFTSDVVAFVFLYIETLNFVLKCGIRKVLCLEDCKTSCDLAKPTSKLYQHDYQWTKDYPLEQVIGEPPRLILTRNHLLTNGEMCIYALSVSTMEPSNVKEAMTNPRWIDSMQDEIL